MKGIKLTDPALHIKHRMNLSVSDEISVADKEGFTTAIDIAAYLFVLGEYADAESWLDKLVLFDKNSICEDLWMRNTFGLALKWQMTDVIDTEKKHELLTAIESMPWGLRIGCLMLSRTSKISES